MLSHIYYKDKDTIKNEYKEENKRKKEALNNIKNKEYIIKKIEDIGVQNDSKYKIIEETTKKSFLSLIKSVVTKEIFDYCETTGMQLDKHYDSFEDALKDKKKYIQNDKNALKDFEVIEYKVKGKNNFKIVEKKFRKEGSYFLIKHQKDSVWGTIQEDCEFYETDKKFNTRIEAEGFLNDENNTFY